MTQTNAEMEDSGILYDRILLDALRSAGRVLETQATFLERFENGHPIYKYANSQPALTPVKKGAPNPLDKKLSLGNEQTVEALSRILTTLETGKFIPHYQPIFNIRQDRPTGYETLTRFMTEPYLSPDRWFADAEQSGLRTQLEITAIHTALAALEHFPEDTYISLNVSPETVLTGLLDSVLHDYPPERLVLEVTAHTHVTDYPGIAMALEPLRNRGVRLAVDDVGAIYASLQHIMQLKPDIIKLDSALIKKIDDEPTSIALATALARFAKQTGTLIIAEGVETVAELETLRSLGIESMQGCLLGSPEPIPPASRQY